MSRQISTAADFRKLAETRLEEAKLLLDAGKWDGAYYLAGYAVEVGLKACVITRVIARGAWLPKGFSDKCHTHNLVALLDVAELKSDWLADTLADATLSANWGIAKDWSEQKRYDVMSEAEAKALYDAIADPAHGAMQWIKKYW